MPLDPVRRRLSLALAAAPLSACSSGSPAAGPAPAPPPARSWRMGFGYFPPRLTTTDVLRGIDEFSRRADFAILHEEVPWPELLAGVTADTLVTQKYVDLVGYMRQRGLRIHFLADLTNGIARERESDTLVAAGRSIAEPEIQRLHQDFLRAVVQRLQPDELGLAAETNLVLAAAPPALYAALVQAANAGASAVRAAGFRGPLVASVQVETAWGVLQAVPGPFVGIARHLNDFAFAEVLGLSSYPYLGWRDPATIPADYYSRLLPAGRAAMVLEGGWSSVAVTTPIGSVAGTPQLQADYVLRHAQLLDSVNAQAVSQLLYADIDLPALPQPQRDAIRPFASLGMVDAQFVPKPAQAAWDALFARPLRL